MKRWMILCLVPLILGNSAAQAVGSSPTTRIVYVAEKVFSNEGKGQIYLLNPDDGTTRLLADAGQAGVLYFKNLNWSGEQFVFDDPGGLYLLDMEGHVQRLLSAKSEHVHFISPSAGSEIRPAERTPAWSPDGRWIALVLGSGDFETLNVFRLYLLDTSLPGEQTQDDLRFVAEVEYPWWDAVNPTASFAWSPDSQKLAFLAPTQDTVDLKVLDIVTGATITIASRGLYDGTQGPAWSPDGAWLAFYSDNAGSSAWGNIFRIHSEGGDLQPLLPEDRVPYVPTWSPDGQWIAMLEYSGDNTYLDRMKADGSALQRLTTALPGSLMAWSPDGEWIAYIGPRCGFDEAGNSKECLYRIQADGTGIPQLLVQAESFSQNSLLWISEK